MRPHAKKNLVATHFGLCCGGLARVCLVVAKEMLFGKKETEVCLWGAKSKRILQITPPPQDCPKQIGFWDVGGRMTGQLIPRGPSL